jgi:hypothetical protein
MFLSSCFAFNIGVLSALKLTESISRVAKELGDLLPKYDPATP